MLERGSHTLGPADATLTVRTFREGVAQKLGHDLIIEVTAWEATVEAGADTTAITLTADPSSLRVREGLNGLKALSDADRREIETSIERKVLRGAPIRFESTGTERSGAGLAVTGTLHIGDASGPVAFELTERAASASVKQTEWGLEPYSGLMGALRVKDTVDVAFTT